MTGVEYVREICRQKGITIRKLELDLGFSNGYLNPKKTKKIPYDKAKQISAAFAFSIGISILFKKGATQGVNLWYTIHIGFYFFYTPDARRQTQFGRQFLPTAGFSKKVKPIVTLFPSSDGIFLCVKKEDEYHPLGLP